MSTKLIRILPRQIFFVLIILVSFHWSYSQDAPALSEDPAVVSAGESLFKANCAACHRVKQQLVGPALEGVYDRRDLPWIISFVRNSQKVIQSGDEYAVNLYNEYNQTLMTSFDFSDEEILSIISYVKVEAEKAPEVAVAEEGATAAAGDGEAEIPYLNAILIGLVLILVIILVVLGLIASILVRYLKQSDELDEADQEIVDQKFGLGPILRSKAAFGIAAFIFTAIVLKTVIDGLFDIGVQQGYQPTQPIAFSHKIHAGDFEIECQYCHTGVQKSRSANIPSANICMNCHGVIKADSEEIKKIYAAVENNRPIEWVRIHNLPDLAYFNHAQHVNVGGVECQTCHGPIETMEVVEQHSLLTMGWCIDCHRKTEINVKGKEEYYETLLKYHESQKAGEPMTVEDIGGLECAKCHY